MKEMTKNMIAKAYCFKRAEYLYFLTVDLKLNIHFKLWHIMIFLVYGKDVKTVTDQPLDEPLHAGRNTVTYEARHLKTLFLKLH